MNELGSGSMRRRAEQFVNHSDIRETRTRKPHPFFLSKGVSAGKLASMTFARLCRVGLSLGLASLVLPARGAELFWKAGVAKVDITPTQPLWGAGYASRTNMIDEKVTALWVKALALEDTE